ncbi:beta-propeller fold lactonase family protein [Subtercola boreus]|uniref:Uncharacterized protein n=1 Tax=Subtercola boreus TaxID=120213 RepID=A0A3E0W6G1_9MICO|nr:beta-propeller fold lactonase family protein [Subtercola boreus]RFA17985.1 hypothetical protein B7R24_15105 [Subtercola boreus]RFA18367.1 hypothetical protein B7R23_15140 [Subtercola boreus]RFA24896.1 hypothetical protein B7R25_15135 [Subtercola boreus]
MKLKVASLITLTVLLTVCSVTSAEAAPTFLVKTVIPHGVAGIGDSPAAVAFDSNHDQAYIANETDNSVSVVNTRTNTVIKTITYDRTSIGRGPSGIAADPVHGQMFVSNYIDGTVSVIDTSTNAVSAVIANGPTSIGDYPKGVALDPSQNKAYVVNSGSRSISVIDTRTRSVSRVVDTGTASDGTPRSVVIDEMRHQAYIVLQDGSGGDEVAVVDTTTDVITKVISSGIGKGASGIAADAGHHEVLVTNYADRTLSVIDTTTDSVRSVVPLGSEAGPGAVAVDASDHYAFVSNEISSSVTVLDLTSGSVLAVIPRGKDGIGFIPGAIAVDDENHQVFVCNLGDGTVSVVSRVRVSPKITSGAAPNGVTGAPYSFDVQATGEPTPSYTIVPWSSLPEGLALDTSSGAIRGVPTKPGSYRIIVQATNGVAPSDFVTYPITILPGVRPSGPLF